MIFPSFILGYFLLTSNLGPGSPRPTKAPPRPPPHLWGDSLRETTQLVDPPVVPATLGSLGGQGHAIPKIRHGMISFRRKKQTRGLGFIRAIPTCKTCIYIYIYTWSNSYCRYITIQISMYMLVYSVGAHFLFSSKVALSCLRMLQRTMLLNHIICILYVYL